MKDVKRMVFEHFCEMLFGVKHPRGIKDWSDIGEIGTNGMSGEEIEELVDLAIKLTAKDIINIISKKLGEDEE